MSFNFLAAITICSDFGAQLSHSLWSRICLQCGRPGFDPWVGKIPWRRVWQPTPVFLSGESHGAAAARLMREKAMATPSSPLAWKIPWTEEAGRLQSMKSLRVGHDWVTSLSLFSFMHWRRKWQPTPVFLPGESQRWGSLVALGSQSRTRLKQLSSSSSSSKVNETGLVWGFLFVSCDL